MKRKLRPSAVRLGVLTGLWFLVVALAAGALVWYEFRPTPTNPGITELAEITRGTATDELPERFAAALADANERPLVVGFLHPHCPCSQATVAELERAVTRIGGTAEGLVLVVRGFHHLGDDWHETPLVARAHRIPGARVIIDMDGTIAGQFDARVSGETFAFAVNGQRIFHGGVTASRGHEGINAGIQAIEAVLDGREPITSRQPVFGCLLDVQTASEHGGHTSHG